MAPDEQWPDIVRGISRSVRAMLETLDERAWPRAAAAVGWDCRTTIEHIGGDFIHYAGQVVSSAEDHYVAFSFDLDRAGTHHELVEAVDMAGGLLAAAVAVAAPDSLGWHPQGRFRPDAYAAMGGCEALVHGYDIAQGVGLPWLPADELAWAVVERVFPDASTRCATHPAGAVLLWATGRRPLRDLPPRTDWDYRQALG